MKKMKMKQPLQIKPKEMKVIEGPEKAKRKRYNKNKKKAWRKKIDITDFEEILEERRREERQGGPIDEKQSEELFTLDLGDDLENSFINLSTKKHKKSANPKGQNSKRTKRRSTTEEERPLKCHQYINGLPGAKAISVKQGTMKQQLPRMLWTALKVSKNTEKAEFRRKMLFSQRKKVLRQNRKILRTDKHKEDIWNRPEVELDRFGEVGKTFMEEPLIFYKEQTKKNKVRTPFSICKKSSLLPSVVPPPGGASYNPSYEDHQDLLKKAVNFENKKLKEEEKQKRMVKKYLPSSKDGLTFTEQLAEMSEGLPWNDDNSQDLTQDKEPENDEQDTATWTGQSKRKKTIQDRKRAKRLKIKEQVRLKKKALNQRQSNVFRVKSYHKEINEVETKLQVANKVRSKKLKKKRYLPKKLSKHTFVESDVMVPLGNEFSKSLLTVKPKGNNLDDIYKNFQRRNIIETRVRVKRTKPKIKQFVKRSVKEHKKSFVESLKE